MGIIRGGIRSNQGVSTGNSPTFAGLILAGINGLDVNPGSDIDADLITVGVTGTPKLWWDEATDSFEMNKSLTLPGGSLKIGTRIIAEDVIDNDGLETPGTLHVSASSGVSANICLHEGTVPTVSASGNGHRIWVDSSNTFYHQDADGTSHKVISDDGSGKVGIGDATPQETLSVAGSADITGDIYTTAWTDYGGTSVLTNIQSATVNIWYKKIGNLVFVNFYISGSFNGATAAFTLPYTSKNSTNFTVRAPLRFVHDGTPDATPGMASLSPNSDTVNIYRSWTGTATWSYTYTHSVQGQFWYEAQ